MFRQQHMTPDKIREAVSSLFSAISYFPVVFLFFRYGKVLNCGLAIQIAVGKPSTCCHIILSMNFLKEDPQSINGCIDQPLTAQFHTSKIIFNFQMQKMGDQPSSKPSQSAASTQSRIPTLSQSSQPTQTSPSKSANQSMDSEDGLRALVTQYREEVQQFGRQNLIYPIRQQKYNSERETSRYGI